MKSTAATLAFSLAPFIVVAAYTPPAGTITPTSPPVVSTIQGVKDIFLCNSLNWLFTAAIVISVGAIIFGAISYMTSGGGEKATKVHQALTYAIVGIVVAILAKGIPVLVSAFLNNSGSPTITSSQIC